MKIYKLNTNIYTCQSCGVDKQSITNTFEETFKLFKHE